MAIIKRKNGLYDVEVYMKSKRVATKRGFRTKAEASGYQDQVKLQYETGTNIAQSGKRKPEITSPTFDDLLSAYIKLHLPKVRIQTQERYKIDIELRLKPRFQYYKLEAITSEMVFQLQADLLQTMKPKSVNNCMAVLNCMFNFGIAIKMAKDNPCKVVKQIKVGIRAHSWWDSWDHVQKFLTTTVNEPLSEDFFEGQKDPCRAAYRLALECGMRLGEIVGLSKQDIDFERNQIHVHRQWMVKHGSYGPTKHNKIRTIGFDPNSDLVGLLKEAIANSPHPEAIFVSLKGDRMRSDKLAGRYFAEWIKKLGLPKITFHDLRHTFASWFMIRGGDVWELMEILGHSDIKTTMRYAHLSKKVKRVPSFNAK